MTTTDREVEDSLNRLTAEFLEAKDKEKADLLRRFREERDRLHRKRGESSRIYQVAKYQYAGMEQLFWHPDALTGWRFENDDS